MQHKNEWDDFEQNWKWTVYDYNMVMQMELMGLPVIHFTGINKIFIQALKNQWVEIRETLYHPYIWDGYLELYKSKNCVYNIEVLDHYLFLKKNSSADVMVWLLGL